MGGWGGAKWICAHSIFFPPLPMSIHSKYDTLKHREGWRGDREVKQSGAFLHLLSVCELCLLCLQLRFCCEGENGDVVTEEEVTTQ